MSGDLLEAPENKAKWYECDEIYIVGGNSVSQKMNRQKNERCQILCS